MSVAILIVVLAVPTALWFATRGRASRPPSPDAASRSPKHRWWQP